MAKILFYLGDIKGKMAGLVFQGGAAGSIVRMKTMPVGTPSAAQMLRRESMAIQARSWAYDLTEDQRLAWESIATGRTRQDGFGNSIAVTGYSLFTELNMNQTLLGGDVLTDAPLNLDVTGLSSVELAGALFGTRNIGGNFAPVQPSNEWLAYFGVLNHRESQSPGLGEYRFLGANAETVPGEFTLDYPDTFPLLAEGAYVTLWIRRWNKVNGVLSPGLLSTILTESP